MQFVTCPECHSPGEVLDRFVMASTDGPIEHVRVVCVLRHWFLLPAATLERLSRPAADGGDLDRGKVSAPTPVPLGMPIRIDRTSLELRP